MPACVRAAELGEVRVTSHIGQPLTADIELTTLDDPAVPVGVRIASPDIYSGAGLALPPVLSSVTLSVTRRDDRQFIHVTSLRPVDADHVHLYLDLVERGQHVVRLATVWLTPDPTPVALVATPVAAPLPVPAAVAARARSAVAEPVPTPAPAPTRRAQDKVAETAPAAPVKTALAPAVPAKAEPVHAAPAKASPDPAAAAPAPGVHAAATASDAAPPAKPAGKAAAPVAAASTAASTAATHAAAPSAAKPVRPTIVPKLPSLHPAQAPAPADASAAACTRPADDALTCGALGNKNAELRAQLASLEEKVKRLQVKLGVTPAAVLPAAAPGTAVLAKLPPPPHPEGGALAVQAVHAAKVALPAKAAAIEAHQESHQDSLKPASKDADKEAIKPPPQKVVKPIVPPGPKPIGAIKPLVPRKPAAPDDDDLPLGWIGAAAAVLALAGATATLVSRRRKTRRVGDRKPGGILNKLKGRFGKRAPAEEGAPAAPALAAVPAPVEPSLD